MGYRLKPLTERAQDHFVLPPSGQPRGPEELGDQKGAQDPPPTPSTHWMGPASAGDPVRPSPPLQRRHKTPTSVGPNGTEHKKPGDWKLDSQEPPVPCWFRLSFLTLELTAV